MKADMVIEPGMMRIRWFGFLPAVSAFFLLLAAPPAAAEPPEAGENQAQGKAENGAGEDKAGGEEKARREEKARKLFEKGNRDLERAARSRGKLKERLLQQALESYLECMELVRNPNLVFNLALALEQLGRFREAFDRYTQYLSYHELTEQERAEASARRDGLLPEVAVISVRSDTPGALVRIDGAEAAPAGTALVERAVEEGEHAVAVSRKGFQDLETSLTARTGEVARVTAELEPLAIEPTEPEPEPEPAGDEPRPAMATVHSNVAARVMLDGKPAGSGKKVKLELGPGSHVLSVSAPGHRTARMIVQAEPGQSRRLRASLAPEVEPGNRLGAWPAVAWMATGVAGVVWAGLGIRALGLKGDYDSHATEERADDLDQANLAADVALAITAAFGATALTLTLVDGPREQEPSRLSLEIGALETGIGLSTSGAIGSL